MSKDYFRKPYMSAGITRHSDYMKAIPQKAIDVQGQIAPNIEFKKPYDYQPNTAQMIHYYSNSLSYLGGDPVPPLNDPSLLPHAPVIPQEIFESFSIAVTPMVSGDDGYYNTLNSSLDTSTIYLDMGYSNPTFKTSVFIRFPSVNIGNRQPLSNSILTLIGHDSGSPGNCNMLIYANNVDNAVAPTTGAGFLALELTASAIQWDNILSVANTSYCTPDLSSIIQPIINRPGWKAKNALMLIIKYNTSTTYRQFASFNHGGQNPSLSITGT